jgi:hypothetical protein
MVALSSFGAGQEPTAAQMVALLPIRAFKSSDTTITSSVVLVNDPDLVAAVNATAEYDVWCHLIYTQGTVGQLNLHFTAPALATFDWVPIALAAAVTASDTGSVSLVGRALADSRAVGGAATPTVATIHGRLVVAGTAGNLQLQWAQSSSSATGTTVKSGSWMSLQQIA